MEIPKLGINPFVFRQTPESSFAHYNGTFKQVIALSNQHWNNVIVAQKSSCGKSRVVLIPLPPQGFYCAHREAQTDEKLEARLFQRQAQEEGFIKITIQGNKIPAKFVHAVFYHKDASEENSSYQSKYEWELVSINASLIEREPLHPITMARNYLEKEGGTKAEYSLQELMEAVWFWKDKISIIPCQKKLAD